MSFEADAIIDRRRLKRALTFWRVAALLVAGVLGAAVAGRVAGVGPVGPYVADLSVADLIVDDAERLDAIAEVRDDDRAKALVVRIDSPGGTVVGGEALYKALRKVAAEKPVVAVMGEMATSAGYMVALGADQIVAREGTLTGSIGVLLQTADVTGLMDKIGIKPETVKSGPLKAQPNPMEPFSDEAREATRDVVLDMYAMFTDIVAERRGMTAAQVKTVADGRVYTGRQARANGLIDLLGGIEEARTWLADVHGVAADLPMKPVEEPVRPSFLDVLGGEALGYWGRGLVESIFGKTVFSEGLRLDGLVSVWHPEWK